MKLLREDDKWLQQADIERNPLTLIHRTPIIRKPAEEDDPRNHRGLNPRGGMAAVEHDRQRCHLATAPPQDPTAEASPRRRDLRNRTRVRAPAWARGVPSAGTI